MTRRGERWDFRGQALKGFESGPDGDGEPLRSPEREKGTGLWMAHEVASSGRMSSKSCARPGKGPREPGGGDGHEAVRMDAAKDPPGLTED